MIELKNGLVIRYGYLGRANSTDGRRPAGRIDPHAYK
jgi:hypothetical protein